MIFFYFIEEDLNQRQEYLTRNKINLKGECREFDKNKMYKLFNFCKYRYEKLEIIERTKGEYYSHIIMLCTIPKISSKVRCLLYILYL